MTHTLQQVASIAACRMKSSETLQDSLMLSCVEIKAQQRRCLLREMVSEYRSGIKEGSDENYESFYLCAGSDRISPDRSAPERSLRDLRGAD
jgi:hypothetical protein